MPFRLRHKLRIGFSVRGNRVTLFEERPAVMSLEDWVKIVVAQFRFDPHEGVWSLYCADRNSRWREYYEAEATPDLEELLAEVDRDPTGIFWG